MVDAATRAWLIDQARQWSRTERNAHQPLAVPLPAAARPGLASFFTRATLDRARWRWVPGIDNPPWRDEAIARGVPAALDFTRLVGLTHDDTILLSRAQALGDQPPPRLLFHELVHVVQYGVLGVDTFVAQYVDAYLAGEDYWLIPLELVAISLEAKLAAAQGLADVFSVEALVQKTVGLRLA
ncbi:MAG TPA: hypothetical protein VJX71_17730 [Methylomirabilota bacterium]|nr:hypothetical protein [Methylomirabilota bacterium]